MIHINMLYAFLGGVRLVTMLPRCDKKSIGLNRLHLNEPLYEVYETYYI